MKLGDKGPEVLAYQQSVFPTDPKLKYCDGICGNDTLLRWRADNDPSLPWQLRRFAKLIGVITRYSMTDITANSNDCSGSACIAHGVPKAPSGRNTSGRWLNTDGMIVDAENGQRVFKKVPLEEVVPGDLVCYGHSKTGVGHVAMVVDPASKLIIDSSGSRNGVHCHIDDKAHFWKAKPGRMVYGLRFVGQPPATDLT